MGESCLSIAGQALELRQVAPAIPGAPWLVFLHDALGALATWRDFPEQLAAATGCGALVYSRRGHGRSDPRSGQPGRRQPGYLHTEAHEVLPALLDALGIERPLLVGHSDGASIALIYASAFSDLPGIVVEAPHVFIEPVTVAGIERAVVAYRETDLRERLARHHTDPDATFAAWADTGRHPAYLDWNIESCLRDIHCPVLMIQGLDDEYGTLAQLDAIERQVAGPVSRLELADCGHAPHKERPAEVLDAIAMFVRGLIVE